MLFCAASTSYNEIIWTKHDPLVWDDFSHKPMNEHFGALTATGIPYSFTSKHTSFEIEVFAVFDRDESWVNKTFANEKLLAHEQVHFDITELWTRKLRKSIEEADFVNAEILNSFYNVHLSDLRRMQAFYDEETHHSLQSTEQQRWVNFVKKELQVLDAYQSSIIIRRNPIVVRQ